MVSREGLVWDVTESAAPRFVGVLAVIFSTGLLVQALVIPSDYRQPLVPVAVWLGMLVAAAWLVPRARSGHFNGAEAAVAVAVAVAAVASVGWDQRAHAIAGPVDWTILGTIWLLALVALSRPAWTWMSGGTLVLAVNAIFVLRVLGVTPLGLARLAAAAYSMVVILAVFAVLRPILRTQVEMAVRRTELASRSAAERAAVAAIQEDRRGRFALLEVEVLPLLRGIADGTLDPADSAVREKCAQLAVTLRRSLMHRTEHGGGLLGALEPALNAATARGLAVEVQVVGDPGCPTPEVAEATLAAVDGVLRALPPHPVTLTVLASGNDAELYLTFDRPLHDTDGATTLSHAVPATARWRATVDLDETGAGCLEVRWRVAVPA
ncbi:MAG TPA: hypothetical protein VMV92_28150 [Streptosporangiaceae bacterium]|nr:hypothetical protein [Streptosporangiaceae bacterium]